MEQESLFKYVEIRNLIKTSLNGKNGGIGDVSYEDLKDSCNNKYFSYISQYNEWNFNQ